MTLKKAELHVHLEGTISPELAQQLAKRNKLPFPQDLIDKDGKSYFSRDFMHFLSVYDTLADLIKTPQDYYDVTFDYLRSNALNGAIYIEMMYSPDHAEKTTGAPSIVNLEAIQQAIDDAYAKHNIVGRIILTAVRHFGVDASIRVAKNYAKGSVSCVTGFGLGGDELNFPPQLFTQAYQIAADCGLACTVHAGEFGAASTMVDAVKHLPIQRIGHGVQVIHSPDTMDFIKDKGIALEVCPSSNIKLGLFKNMEEHPFPKLLEAGIKVSLNSDDPPFMSTTLANEYSKVQSAYKYSDEVMNSITAMALDCAFVDEATRAELHQKLAGAS